MEGLLGSKHLVQPAAHLSAHCISLPRPPRGVQPFRPSPLPLLSTRSKVERRARRTYSLRERTERLRLCCLLHRFPLFHARVYNAKVATPICCQCRHEDSWTTGTFHGASIHGHVLCHSWTIGTLCHVQDTRLVFQHGRHVRGIPSPDTRGAVQRVLPDPSELLGTADDCAPLDARKTTTRLSPAGGSPFHHARAHLSELHIPLHLHGTGRVHHARHF
jgi:hypothetical protein